MFFHFLSCSFIFFHCFLSLSFIFFHFLSFSFIFFHFLSIFFPFSFHFLTFSFIVFHCLSLCFSSFFSFLLVLLFLGCSKSSFFASIASRFPNKLLCKKSFFWGRLGGVLHWAAFFSLVYFFTFFHFRFLFQFLSMLFLFFLCFSFFHFLLLSFPFLFTLKKCFFLFHFVSLFSFLGCSKSVAALQDSLGKSAHSELALFALYWLVVTFPCGIVHILVMIRLRVVYGGRRVGQVLPSYQNRQISALDETADAPQSSLFSLFSLLSPPSSLLPLSSLFITVLSIIISVLQNQVPHSPSPPFSLGNE